MKNIIHLGDFIQPYTDMVLLKKFNVDTEFKCDNNRMLIPNELIIVDKRKIMRNIGEDYVEYTI